MKTMKIMKRLMGCAAAILALTACSESEDLLAAYHSDSKAVHITAQVGKASADGFTRSNPLGDADAQTKFNENDEISVQADGQDAVTYKYDGSKWEPQGGKYLKWEKETMNFTAYYPATYGGVLSQPKSYPDEASLIAADYMSFTGDVKNPGDNSLKLTMKRKMARVVIEIVKFNDQYAEGTKVNSVTINGDVKAYKQSDNTYYALMVPCEAETTKEFLSLEVGASNAKETLTGIPALEAGKSYTYQLTVGKNKISVSGITVKDWTTGETIPGGKAEIIPYVTFKADEEQEFYITATEGYTIPNLEYSVNNGKWTPVVAKEKVTFGGAYGDLRLRGINNINGTSSNDYNQTTWDFDYIQICFYRNVTVACEGDIRTLLDYKTYKTVNTNKARFYKLFMNCSELTSAPELPATTLADGCYFKMFYGCGNLTSAPELPATTLAESCYTEMFYNCSQLTSAPKLPATTLAADCYYNMFFSCSQLTSAPDLPATTLVVDCYNGMFYGCTKLSTVTMLASKKGITSSGYGLGKWLYDAGTDASSRTLKVTDADAYNALVDKGYLPDIWKKGAGGATVVDENDKVINIE